MNWRSYNNQIYINGNRFNMKGLSWFGYETGNYGLYGLDRHDEDWYFNWMRERGFNAMRLPFSGDFIRGGTNNKNAYKATIQKAAEYGIMVMVDYHSDTAGSWRDGLNTLNPQSAAVSLWGEVADLLKDEWNVFMADVFNEPHDVSNELNKLIYNIFKYICLCICVYKLLLSTKLCFFVSIVNGVAGLIFVKM